MCIISSILWPWIGINWGTGKSLSGGRGETVIAEDLCLVGAHNDVEKRKRVTLDCRAFGASGAKP